MINDRLDPSGLHRIPEMVNVSVASGTRIVHISGQVAIDTDGNVIGSTHLDQARVVWQHLVTALEAAGATLTDVAKVTTYIVDYSLGALQALLTAATDVLGGDYPTTANTLVGVSALWLPDLLIEIEAVAVI